VRVVIADRQASVRYALRVLLLRKKMMEIVGEAQNMASLMEQMLQREPDLILLDWELPGMTGLSSIAALRDLNPELTIIAMSGLPGVRQEALAAGVNGFIQKTEPPDRLLDLLKHFSTQASDL
jgi:DNA-binding NarL/FixJ family response regulator